MKKEFKYDVGDRVNWFDHNNNVLFGKIAEVVYFKDARCEEVRYLINIDPKIRKKYNLIKTLEAKFEHQIIMKII